MLSELWSGNRVYKNQQEAGIAMAMAISISIKEDEKKEEAMDILKVNDQTKKTKHKIHKKKTLLSCSLNLLLAT